MKDFKVQCSKCGCHQYSELRPVTWNCSMCGQVNKFHAQNTCVRYTADSEELLVYLTIECEKQSIGITNEQGIIHLHSTRKEILMDLLLEKAESYRSLPHPDYPEGLKRYVNGRATIGYICPLTDTTYTVQDRVIEILYLRFIKKMPFTLNMKIYDRNRDMELKVRRLKREW